MDVTKMLADLRQEREQIVVEIEHETFGLGPLEPLMQDPTVCDILVNGAITFESNECTGALPGKLLRSYDMID